MSVASAVDFEAARSAASGLVSISTSDTSLNPVLEIDTAAARVKKMRRRVVRAASTHEAATLLRPAMVTLTYARMDGWSPRHISEALKRVRQWMGRRGHAFRYVWTAELQDRGAIHYHVVTWLPEGKEKPPFWDAQGWWPHGSSRSEWARNAVGYIVKYASKIDTKDRLPCGARMHGSGGFTAVERQKLSFESKPTWARTLSYIGQKMRRAEGGGFVQHFACGLRRRLISPFVLVGRIGGRVLLARRGSDPNLIRTALGDIWQQIAAPTTALA